jgi:hypothetical protein
MNEISKIQTQQDKISWVYNGHEYTCSSLGNIESAMALRASPGIAVVARQKNEKPRAYLLNADGSIRSEVPSPYRPETEFEPYYFNYEAGKLILVFASSTRDFAHVIDEQTGKSIESHETR